MCSPIFTPDGLILEGKTLPARYAIAENDTVYAYITSIEYGEECHLTITLSPDHEYHAAAMAAAIQALRPETISEEPPALIEPEQPAKPEKPARNPKETRGEVPEKLFAGLEITGNGWRILFDKTYDRTRVIFKEMPSKAAREAVKAAGFYWSPSLESWNKKLTFKAFRKAQALAVQLRAICG